MDNDCFYKVFLWTTHYILLTMYILYVVVNKCKWRFQIKYNIIVLFVLYLKMK